MTSVRWAAAAVNDLEAIRAYYDEAGEGHAQPVIDRIVLATDWLLDWPHAGAPLGTSGWHRWKPRRTPHVLLYRPTAEGIEIGRVRHDRENWMADL